MDNIVLLTHEKNGLKYELIASEVDPSMFDSGIESYSTPTVVKVTPVDHQHKQGT